MFSKVTVLSVPLDGHLAELLKKHDVPRQLLVQPIDHGLEVWFSHTFEVVREHCPSIGGWFDSAGTKSLDAAKGFESADVQALPPTDGFVPLEDSGLEGNLTQAVQAWKVVEGEPLGIGLVLVICQLLLERTPALEERLALLFANW